MSFQDMKDALQSAYERNVYNSRLQLLAKDGHAIVGEQPGRRRIPSLSGLSGIGKTACVEAFAKEKGFELVRLDCSYMPVSMLVVKMHDACKRIAAKETEGCVLLVDNFDQADQEWREVLVQYADGYLDATVEVRDAGEPTMKTKLRVGVEEVPETLFLIGEERPE
jgi:hypothetical protein